MRQFIIERNIEGARSLGIVEVVEVVEVVGPDTACGATREHSGSQPQTESGRTMRKIITTAAIAAALVVPGTATGVQAASPTCETMVDSVTSADAAEGRILRCLDAIETAYTDCMLKAPGAADRLERWAPLCRAAVED